MPPKKVAVKGSKGKAKAQDKEEKKQAKVVKAAPKGNLELTFVVGLTVYSI